jgi:chemotaxis protein CheC
MQDEMDILREVGSIAAAHGSIALSEILGRKINLFLPSLDIVSSVEVSTKMDVESVGIAVTARIATGLKGETAFLLNEDNAFKLTGLSCKIDEKDKNSAVLTEIGISTLKEIGNIVISAYLGAVGMILKRVVLSLPPTLISGTMNEILNILVSFSRTDEYVLLIEAVFEESTEKIKGGFYLLLCRESASDIKRACEQMLADLGKGGA